MDTLAMELADQGNHSKESSRVFSVLQCLYSRRVVRVVTTYVASRREESALVPLI